MVFKPESFWEGVVVHIVPERYLEMNHSDLGMSWVGWGGSQLGVLFVGIAGNVYHLWMHRNHQKHIRTPRSRPGPTRVESFL